MLPSLMNSFILKNLNIIFAGLEIKDYLSADKILFKDFALNILFVAFL
jgi:hypothetical protein